VCVGGTRATKTCFRNVIAYGCVTTVSIHTIAIREKTVYPVIPQMAIYGQLLKKRKVYTQENSNA